MAQLRKQKPRKTRLKLGEGSKIDAFYDRYPHISPGDDAVTFTYEAYLQFLREVDCKFERLEHDFTSCIRSIQTQITGIRMEIDGFGNSVHLLVDSIRLIPDVAALEEKLRR